MKEPEMRAIAEIIDMVLSKPGDEKVRETARRKVRELCDAFPIWPDGD